MDKQASAIIKHFQLSTFAKLQVSSFQNNLPTRRSQPFKEQNHTCVPTSITNSRPSTLYHIQSMIETHRISSAPLRVEVEVHL